MKELMEPKTKRSVQFSCTSAPMQEYSFPFLPQELITDILSWLPVKSLLRYTCVSKSWLALISSPEFIKTHLSIRANNKDFTHHALMLGTCQRPDASVKYCSLRSLLYDSHPEAFDLGYHPMRELGKSFSIVGSVNGLVCFSIDEQHNFLWNPSTRKFKQLPYSRSTLKSKYFWMYGFGYDESDDDYKVVGITSSRDKVLHNVNMYSLNSHCWRNTDHFQGRTLPYRKSGVFVNGRLHWTACISGAFNDNYGQGIISVNLADGKYEKVEHPRFGGGGRFDLMPGVLGNDLCVVCNHWRTHMVVWVMKEYGVKESWIEMLKISPSDVLSPQICMSNKSQILFHVGSTLMLYDQKDKSSRRLLITNCAYFREAKVYVESLVSPFRLKKPRMQQKRGLKKLKRRGVPNTFFFS